ncbi:MAG: hypothetical protein QOF31_2522, partial [Mycobacterium sp.]|nr:hypothetical protein [Mycobacterium sp.]
MLAECVSSSAGRTWRIMQATSTPRR